MSKPTVAVHKFSSCDGCQLSILNLEDELLDLVGAIEIAYFLEATSAILPGPYDIALVEGSVTTQHEVERLQKIRAESEYCDCHRHLRYRRGHPVPAELWGCCRDGRFHLRSPRISALPGYIHGHFGTHPG